MRSSIHLTCHQRKDGARSYPPDALIVSGTTYYVSNNGNDEADGISLATAWQTLARVSEASLLAGDGMRFRRGKPKALNHALCSIKRSYAFKSDL